MGTKSIKYLICGSCVCTYGCGIWPPAFATWFRIVFCGGSKWLAAESHERVWAQHPPIFGQRHFEMLAGWGARCQAYGIINSPWVNTMLTALAVGRMWREDWGTSAVDWGTSAAEHADHKHKNIPMVLGFHRICPYNARSLACQHGVAIVFL